MAHRPHLGILFVLVFATLLPLSAAAQTFTVSIQRSGPPNGSWSSTFFTDALAIDVDVTAPGTLASVVAIVGGQSIALSRNFGSEPGSSYWVGLMSTSALPLGPHTLVVRATTTGGAIAEQSRTVTRDALPTIECLAPNDDVLARPDVRVRARCTDDAGPCRLTVSGAPEVDAVGELDAIVSVPFDDYATRTDLVVTATDLYDRQVTCTRYVYVEPNPHLAHVATLPGHILDVDATRALVHLPDEANNRSSWAIVRRETGASQTIHTSTFDRYTYTQAWLTPTGALLAPDDWGRRLYEWRDEALSQIGTLDYSSEVRISGIWAVFVTYATFPTYESEVVRRNLLTGVNETLATGDIERAEVGQDGAVVYEAHVSSSPFSFYRLVRVQSGVSTTVIEQNFSTRFQSDGTLVAFIHQPEVERRLSLWAPSGQETLTETLGSSDGFLVNRGWTAYPYSSSAPEIWTRTPTGTRLPMTPNDHASAGALSPTGEVLFDLRRSEVGYRRMLARASLPLLEVGSPRWPVRWISGAWHMLVGPHLLRVTDRSTSLLSEGATGDFFQTEIAILNPALTPTTAQVSFFREDGGRIDQTREIPAHTRSTIRVNGEVGPTAAAVSTQVTTERGPLVVERTMSWDASGYGGHSGSAVDRPRPRWLFAEGAQGYFDTFILLVNDSDVEADVTLKFLLEVGAPVVRRLAVRPHARATVYAGLIPELVNQAFSTIVESTVPVVAERAMYFGASPQWTGGHGSAGVPEAATHWFHAEGATGEVFDTFILLANVNPREALVQLRFLTDTGLSISRSYTLPALSRTTSQVVGLAQSLGAASFATTVESNIPIVSERAMYWSTTGGPWQEAHNSFGVTSTATKWATADGRVGGPRNYQTYVLVANPTSSRASLLVRFMRDDGVEVFRTIGLDGNSRLNIACHEIPELVNREFGVVVHSLGVPIAVERATYWDAGGVTWAAGTNVTATPIP